MHAAEGHDESRVDHDHTEAIQEPGKLLNEGNAREDQNAAEHEHSEQTVIQRVPLRIAFDNNDAMVRRLKAGMSVNVSIDTNHHRSLAGLFGFGPAKAAGPEHGTDGAK